MTPPESPSDLRSKTASPSTPLAASTPTGTAELKSPTAAELKRQFLFGADDSQQGDVFADEVSHLCNDSSYINRYTFTILFAY